jgi:surface polysaccharide O-acyltransferase-like enzyme
VIVKNEYMRTTTNIYLFNLALADLATLLFAMPAELYLMWRQYPWTFGEVGSNMCMRHTAGSQHNKRPPTARVPDPNGPVW